MAGLEGREGPEEGPPPDRDLQVPENRQGGLRCQQIRQITGGIQNHKCCPGTMDKKSFQEIPVVLPCSTSLLRQMQSLRMTWESLSHVGAAMGEVAIGVRSVEGNSAICITFTNATSLCPAIWVLGVLAWLHLHQ